MQKHILTDHLLKVKNTWIWFLDLYFWSFYNICALLM